MTSEERLRIHIAISFIEAVTERGCDAGDQSKSNHQFHDLKAAIKKGEIEVALAIAEEIQQWLRGALIQLRKNQI